jgi:diadenosine tetraphosphatase ApaH/serine/threonine PP2A family protein phosphatase
LEHAQGRYDQVWYLGDVVGYGPHPNECIELLAGLPCLGVAGNHDWAVLGKLELDYFNPTAAHVLEWTRSVLTPSHMRFLESLGERIVPAEHFTLVHGSPRHPIWEYVLTRVDATFALRDLTTRYGFLGHTHIPVIFQSVPRHGALCREIPLYADASTRALTEESLLINPGSVGQPRDGDPRASYMILDWEERTLEHFRVEYPVERTQKAMFEHNLPVPLIYRLSLGR